MGLAGPPSCREGHGEGKAIMDVAGLTRLSQQQRAHVLARRAGYAPGT